MSSSPWRTALISALTVVALSVVLLPLSTVLCVYCGLRSSLGDFRLPFVSHDRALITKRRILLTGANTRSAINLARLLKRSGCVVVAADFETVPLLSTCRYSSVYKRFYRLNKPKSHHERPKKTTDLVRFGWFGGISHSTQERVVSAKDSESLYIADLSAIAMREKIDMWMPCEDISEQNFPMIAAARNLLGSLEVASIVPDDKLWAAVHSQKSDVEKLAISFGFRVPEEWTVRSRHEIHKILGRSGPDTKRYALKRLHAPTTNGDSLNGNGPRKPRPDSGIIISTPLPPPAPLTNGFQAEVEKSPDLPMGSTNATYSYVAGINISAAEPWTLRETTTGPQYRTHSLISRGRVAHFAVTVEDYTGSAGKTRRPSHSTDNDLSGSDARIVLSPSNRVHRLLLAFTRRFAAHVSAARKESGDAEIAVHLRQTFAVAEHAAGGEISSCVYYLGTEFGVDSSLAALAGDGVCRKVAEEYVKVGSDRAGASGAASKEDNGEQSYYLIDSSFHSSQSSQVWEGKRGGELERADGETIVLPSPDSTLRGLYSFPLSFWRYSVVPYMRVLLLKEKSLRTAIEGSLVLAERVLFWKEEGFDEADPWAWWWEWHVRRPVAATAEVFSGLSLRQKSK